MNLNEETGKGVSSPVVVPGTNSFSQHDFEEPEYTLDYCEDIDDSYHETDGTLSVDPADGYIASSSDEMTDSDDNYGCKTQRKTIPDCDTENAVTGIKIAPPGLQVNDVIGVNVRDTNQDIDAISHGVTNLNTCAKDQDVNSLNKTDSNHSVNGINNINTQDDDHDCASSAASVVDGAANKDSAQTANSSSDTLSDLFFIRQT